MNTRYDYKMSITSANTIRVDSFWLDQEEQKSQSPVFNINHNGYHHRNGGDSHTNNGDEGSNDDEEEEEEEEEEVDEGDIISPRLTDQHLAAFNGKRSEMASFRISHAMDSVSQNGQN
eukprot:132631_1